MMSYSTDLTDKQWAIVREIVGKENRGRHFVKHSKRELINAVLYLNKTGCQWALLPNDFPPYKTVSSFYHRAKQSGLWEKIMSALVKKIRRKAGRKPTPSYAVIDSQSAKTMYASDERGFDGGKKIKGRKRHTVTDTMGMLFERYSVQQGFREHYPLKASRLYITIEDNLINRPPPAKEPPYMDLRRPSLLLFLKWKSL